MAEELEPLYTEAQAAMTTEGFHYLPRHIVASRPDWRKLIAKPAWRRRSASAKG